MFNIFPLFEETQRLPLENSDVLQGLVGKLYLKVLVNALLCVQAIYLYELKLLHESEILQGKALLISNL